MAIDLSDVLPTEPVAISFDKSISRGGRYHHCHRHRNFRKLDAYHFRQFDRQCFRADARFQPIGFTKQFEGHARAQRDEYDHREPAEWFQRQSLSASGFPNGVTASFSPSSTTGALARSRYKQVTLRVREYTPHGEVSLLYAQAGRSVEKIVRVIVRELVTKPSETSLKFSALRVDFIGSCRTACVGV